MDQLHINYDLEHAGLLEENAKLKAVATPKASQNNICHDE